MLPSKYKNLKIDISVCDKEIKTDKQLEDEYLKFIHQYAPETGLQMVGYSFVWQY
jgi:hypothetical protein